MHLYGKKGRACDHFTLLGFFALTLQHPGLFGPARGNPEGMSKGQLTEELWITSKG